MKAMRGNVVRMHYILTDNGGEVLDRSGWRMQNAAERLGISRVTLWRKLRDHGIERPEQT